QAAQDLHVDGLGRIERVLGFVFVLSHHSPRRPVNAIYGPRMAAIFLLHSPHFTRCPGSRHRSARAIYSVSSSSGSDCPTYPPGTLDTADLALRFSHGSCRLLDALSPLSIIVIRVYNSRQRNGLLWSAAIDRRFG